MARIRRHAQDARRGQSLASVRRTILQVCAVDFTAMFLLRPLMDSWRQSGWDVAFACSDGPWAEQLRAAGFRHHAIPVSRSIAPVTNFAATVRLAWLIRSSRPTVVHTHTPIGGIVGRAAARLARTQVIAHTFHGLPLLTGSRRTARENAFLRVERLLARVTHQFFSQAAGDAERAVQLRIARRDRMTIIGNGVDLVRFRQPDASERSAIRAELAVPHDAVLVMTTARMIREKGVLDLAAAAYELRDRTNVHFALVGGALPSDRDVVTAELDDHPVTSRLGSRWRRLDHREDVARLLRAADIFVLPSHREGLPRSIIEALATGLPVIATDLPGCRELVDDAAGQLVPVGDARALADAISALAEDRARRVRLGLHARELAATRHDERRILARQIDIISRLVA